MRRILPVHSVSHARRRWEQESSISMCFVSHASDRRSAAWPLACSSSVHSCRSFHLLCCCASSCGRTPSQTPLSFSVSGPSGLLEISHALLLSVLETLHFLCALLPTLQTSRPVAWPHVQELLALLSSILALGLALGLEVEV